MELIALATSPTCRKLPGCDAASPIVVICCDQSAWTGEVHVGQCRTVWEANPLSGICMELPRLPALDVSCTFWACVVKVAHDTCQGCQSCNELLFRE